jgi:signal transduction histidine kinase
MGLVSEAISNAARHAHAAHVKVELCPGLHDRVRLRISDDGTGFDPRAPLSQAAGGFGLVSMRERAAALGGEIRLESEPGVGTLIEVALQ